MAGDDTVGDTTSGGGHDDLAARALDALDGVETRAFDATADAATHAEVDALRDVLGRLSASGAVAPPADMRASLLSQIARTPQDDPGAVEPVVPADAEPATPRAVEPTPRDTVAQAAESQDPAVGPRERAARRRWLGRPVLLAGSAAAAVGVLLGGIAIGQSTRPADPLATIVHAPDVESSTAELADGTFATVLWSAERGDAAVVFDDLERLDADLVYEAWLIRGDDAIAAGLFESSDGTVVHVLDGELLPGDTIGVTVEPAGGSAAPTTDPILVAETT